MKVFPKKIASHVTNIIERKIKAILFYGPEQGIVSQFINKIVKLVNGTIINLNYSDINDKGCSNYFLSQNLFGIVEILKINNCTATIHEDLKVALLSEYAHIPVFIAEELTPTSSLRKYFETQDNLLAVACYSEDAADLKDFIAVFLRDKQYQIEKTALEYLTINLPSNRSIIEQELNKISALQDSLINKEVIDLKTVESAISMNLEYSTEQLSYNFANCEIGNYFSELQKLQHDNILPIRIIRSLIRLYTNLYVVKLSLLSDNGFNDAIKTARPPIFFKFLELFKNLVHKLSIQQINYNLFLLIQTESYCKITGSYPENICEAIFFQIHNRSLSNTNNLPLNI